MDDPEERAFIEPRLQHLLGLTERVAPDREDLFSAWRLFVERMAQQDPVVMVFEDIHWADAALLEFVEALLERSRSHPIFVLTLARPDLVDRHPGWGARVRSFTSVTLDPLDDDAIDALLRGLVPGIDDDAIERIRERAEGVPFYAVETVRMLLDRGLLEPGEAGYRVTGDLSSLQVPETLQTLIAARLDALEADERALLQDASVLGRTFTARGLAALAGGDEASLRPLLDDLARKELLYLDSDPFSPERGQYGFLQALVQRVAYETLSRRDRKAKHLAAAAYLAEHAGIDPDEIAEVVAAHYLDAFRADEDAEDAADIRANARGWLERAAERATSLAAAEEAQRAFQAAAELADDPLERAGLIERAGDMARMGNRMNDAEGLLTQARDLYTQAGDPHGSARTAASISRALVSYGRTEDAIRLAEEAYEVLGADELDRDGAALAAELARLHYFVGDLDTAMARIESAIPVAERTKDMALLASTLNTKSLLYSIDRPHEAYALVHAALRIALDHDLVFEALRAYNNSMVQLEQLDRSEDMLPLLEEALALARRRGDRQWLDRLTAAAITESIVRGRWDEAEAHAQEYEPATTDIGSLQAYAELAEIAWERGDASESRTRLDRIATASADPGDRQWRQALLMARRTRYILDRSFDGALETALEEVAAPARKPGAGPVHRARASPRRFARAARRGSLARGTHTRGRQGCLRRGRAAHRDRDDREARGRAGGSAWRSRRRRRAVRGCARRSPQPRLRPMGGRDPRRLRGFAHRGRATRGRRTASRRGPGDRRAAALGAPPRAHRSDRSDGFARESAHELTKARSPDSAKRLISSARELMSSLR